MNRRTFLKFLISGGAGALIASYPFAMERFMFLVNVYRIPVPHLPPPFYHFRIAHLTDLHCGHYMPQRLLRFVIDRTLSLNANAVVCTGDYVHGRNTSVPIDTIWPIMLKLKAAYGVHAVLGNHDHWADANRSLHWLEKSGWNVRHKAVPISKSGRRIWIGGAGDYLEDHDGIDKAFSNVPKNECKMLLAHNPDTADLRFSTRIDLMISGHTHGGQVIVPFHGPPILPVHNKRYTSGFIRSKQTNVFISRGIGTAILPIRFNCFPEIAVLELVPRA